MNSNLKTAIFWVVLIMLVVVFVTVVRTGQRGPDRNLIFTQFVHDVSDHKVKEVTISGMEVHGTYTDGAAFHTLIPERYEKIYDKLQDNNVSITVKEANASNWLSLLINAIPFILLLAFWIFMMRQMQSGGNKALSFGKSRARLHSSQQKKVTFKDVAGVEEAKEELQEIIEFLREPQ